MTRAVAASTIRGMKLRATAPEPCTVEIEATVSHRLYGEHRELRATPIRRGRPTALGARYRLLERLGTGGTADVYRAQDERLRRDVAVKVVAEWLAQDASTVRRFRREAELCARLAHRNLAAVLDAGSRPRDYIVMELVDGENAATLLERKQPLATTHAVDVLAQISDALEHAHAHGVIHGDVAPRNILIGRRDRTAKLVDFGLAVDRFGAAPDGAIMGTPGYVAPEILRGGRPSPHSDLFSLGAVAHRLLGGPDVPASVTAVVASARAPHPAARPASAAEFRDRLLT